MLLTSQGGALTATTRRHAWSVFALLVGLMVVNHLDRQIVVSTFPLLKAQWSLSDTALGALVSVVAVTVAVATIPLSFMADRAGRVRSLFVMALVWSLATAACALASSYGELFAARAVIGLGEAAFGSVGCALLVALFPERIRSTVVGGFLSAGLIGSVLGVALGGVIGQRWGWQAAFVVAAVPGAIIAILFAGVAREPSTPPLPSVPADEGVTRVARAMLAELWAPRSAIVASLGAGLQLIVVSTAYAWLPSYLNRQYGLPSGDAGLIAGAIVLLGVPGVLLSSMLTDRLSQRYARARLYVPAIAATLTAVFMCTAIGALRPGVLQITLIGLGALTMTGTVGPVTAAVMDVMHPAVRSSAAAFLAATQNLFGLAVGPVLAGLISDRYGLSTAMAVIPLFCAVAGLLFAWAGSPYPRDLARLERHPLRRGA